MLAPAPALSPAPLKPARLVALLALLAAGPAHAAGPAPRASSPASANATPPTVIPRTVLFGNAARDLMQFSPDGRRISWLAPDAQGVQNVWAQDVGADSVKAVTHESHRPIYW